MTGFHPDWLALREPYDHAARDDRLASRLDGWLDAGSGSRIMDLGCGTGSNLRYLGPRLPQTLAWRLVDHDDGLLTALARSDGFDVRRQETVLHDLTDLEGLPFDGSDAVVASALMDLVSEAWFAELAARCSEAGAALLFVLNYSGRMDWLPELPDDRWIETQFNAHQRGTKQFGPAMGPDALEIMSGVLRSLDYEVSAARTPWILGPRDREIQAELIRGIAGACLELAPREAHRTTNWSNRRAQLVADGRSGLSVGHGDLLALPPGTRG